MPALAAWGGVRALCRGNDGLVGLADSATPSTEALPPSLQNGMRGMKAPLSQGQQAPLVRAAGTRSAGRVQGYVSTCMGCDGVHQRRIVVKIAARGKTEPRQGWSSGYAGWQQRKHEQAKGREGRVGRLGLSLPPSLSWHVVACRLELRVHPGTVPAARRSTRPRPWLKTGPAWPRRQPCLRASRGREKPAGIGG